MEEFGKDRYGVDVLKVEVPVNMEFVEGAKALRRTEGLHASTKPWITFREPPTVATKPFIYLSAGVSNPEFIELWSSRPKSGVKFNGVLCGRATWKDGIPDLRQAGRRGLPKWLQTEGVKNINNVNDALKAATSWHSIYGVEPAMVGA